MVSHAGNHGRHRVCTLNKEVSSYSEPLALASLSMLVSVPNYCRARALDSDACPQLGIPLKGMAMPHVPIQDYHGHMPHTGAMKDENGQVLNKVLSSAVEIEKDKRIPTLTGQRVSPCREK